MTTPPPIFTDALQVAIIVRDLDAAMRRYHDEYGVGPWAIFEFNPQTIDDMVIDDEPAEYAMRLAVAFIGRLQFELIEPLDNRSIYAQHLADHGEGPHHVALNVDDYTEAERRLRGKGHHILMGGNHEGVTYAYFSTQRRSGSRSSSTAPSRRGRPTPSTRRARSRRSPDRCAGRISSEPSSPPFAQLATETAAASPGCRISRSRAGLLRPPHTAPICESEPGRETHRIGGEGCCPCIRSPGRGDDGEDLR